MDFDRSTQGITPLRWLNVIQRGGTQDWKGLYVRCRDRAFAEQVARLLPMSDPDLLPSGRLWKFLLQDLHADLPVDLPQGRPEVAAPET